MSLKSSVANSTLMPSVLEAGQGGAADPAFSGRGFYIAAAGGAAYQNLVIHLSQVLPALI